MGLENLYAERPILLYALKVTWVTLWFTTVQIVLILSLNIGIGEESCDIYSNGFRYSGYLFSHFTVLYPCFKDSKDIQLHG